MLTLWSAIVKLVGKVGEWFMVWKAGRDHAQRAQLQADAKAREKQIEILANRPDRRTALKRLRDKDY